MKRMHKVCAAALAAVPLVGLFSSARGATITWGPATSVSTGATAGDTDIVNTGTLVAAYSVGTGGTENSVTFTHNPASSSPYFGTNILVTAQGDTSSGVSNYENAGGSFDTTGDSTYDAILSKALFDGTNVVQTITFGGLTSGDMYEFQLWAIGGGSTSGIHLTSNVGSTNSSNYFLVPDGDYITGTFTADSTLQQQIGYGYGGTNDDILDAIQLRQIAVPEPASLCALGLGSLGLLARRQKR